SQCMPGQRRTFHPQRKLRNPGERRELAHLVSASVSGDKVVKLAEELFCFAGAFALQALRHHGSRGFGDRAARAFEGDIVNRAVLHIDVHGEVIAAERIETLGLVIRRIHRPKVSGVLAVFENHFLVQLPQFRHYPSTSFTLWIPFTSASTSWRVLYSPKDARAVAGIPNRCITGWAQ